MVTPAKNAKKGLKMREKMAVLIVMAVVLTIAAWAQQEPEIQPASAPVVDPVRAEVIRLASIDPVKFDATMVAVSDTLSDEEFGRYSRLYKANFQGNDLVEKLGNAYDGSPITAHAMQAAALSMLQAEAQALQSRLVEVQGKLQAVNTEFQQYGE